MKFIEKVIGFTIFNLTTLFIMIIYHMAISNLVPALRSGANETGTYALCNPIWTNIEKVGWIFFMIILVGSAIYLLVSSHQDESEQYQYPRNPGGFGGM